MHKSLILVAAIFLAGVLAFLVFNGRPAPNLNQAEANSAGNAGATIEANTQLVDEGDSPTVETEQSETRTGSSIPVEHEIEIRNWLVSRGHHLAIDGERHPYTDYDLQTLEALAETGDSMAKLILAERLYLSSESRERGRDLYISAAVDGLTAGLITMTIDTYYDRYTGAPNIQFIEADGSLNEETANLFSVLAAGEFLGDPMASESLRTLLESKSLNVTQQDLDHICDVGAKFANDVREERISIGVPENQDAAPTGINWPESVCSF